MTRITTHVLDTSRGRPAAGLVVRLERENGTDWQLLGNGTTDKDGRARDLMPSPLQPGTYRIWFETGPWFETQGINAFFPSVVILFRVADASQHYHVPLLLSPFGYSTYRGS